MKRHQIKPCPVCGQKFGWFEKRVVSYFQAFKPDGGYYFSSKPDAIVSGRRKFCLTCKGDITKLIK